MFHSETLPTEQCQSNSLVNATQKHPINNYQSVSKSLEVIRREIDIFDDKSTFNELANHNHSKYNGKWRGGKR